jgi:hypothetical protein
MVIAYMHKMEDGYHLLVVAKEYVCGWAKEPLPKQGTLGRVTDCLYEEAIWQFRSLENGVEE